MYNLLRKKETLPLHRNGWYQKILCTCFAVILTVLLASPSVAYAHYDTAYWNNGTRVQNKAAWMKYLDGNLQLSQLSLPGTHDTMAHKSNLLGLDITRTQTMDLRSQLVSGIRVLDIRLYYEGNSRKFTIHHGTVYLGYDLDDVLTIVQEFLREYPSETVLMRLKQEGSSASDEQMKRMFDLYYNRYQDMFYKKNGSNNPTLNDMRGKCVIISDVWSLNSYGLSYRDLNIQDAYHLNTNWDLYAKWEKVKNHISLANKSGNSGIYMNYLSGSGGAFPYFVASGHTSPGTSADRLATGLT
ncbi:MAG: phosphatidylinositol-specific phospholipase C [Clostridiales bacterium]|nr:phosphatidylinositol-specific phospholipase C [Clostridiales bacterium]